MNAKFLKDLGIYSEKSTAAERYTETHKQWLRWNKTGHPDKAEQLGKNREDMHNIYIRAQACKDKVYPSF